MAIFISVGEFRYESTNNNLYDTGTNFPQFPRRIFATNMANKSAFRLPLPSHTLHFSTARNESTPEYPPRPFLVNPQFFSRSDPHPLSTEELSTRFKQSSITTPAGRWGMGIPHSSASGRKSNV